MYMCNMWGLRCIFANRPLLKVGPPIICWMQTSNVRTLLGCRLCCKKSPATFQAPSWRGRGYDLFTSESSLFDFLSFSFYLISTTCNFRLFRMMLISMHLTLDMRPYQAPKKWLDWNFEKHWFPSSWHNVPKNVAINGDTYIISLLT